MILTGKHRAGLEERELLLKSRTSKKSLQVMVEMNTWYSVGFIKTDKAEKENSELLLCLYTVA